MLFLSFDLVKSLVYMYSVYVCNSKLNPAVNMQTWSMFLNCLHVASVLSQKIYTDPW